MKKLNSFFLMGSVALAGLGVMSSCSSDDLGTDSTNITDNKAVKTQFALNIPRANGGTRMSETNTQANGNFLGMEDIRLYSFSDEPGETSTSTKTFTLSDISTGISSTASSKIYNDVEVPVGTKNFLFYAHAPQGTDDATSFTKGVLNFTYKTDNATATSEIKANLKKLAGTDDTSPSTLLDILNGVTGVTGWADADAISELGKLYKKYTSAKAGSANSIRLTLQSLYNNLGGIVTGANDEHKKIAENIRTKIAESFTAKSTNGYVTLSYKATDDVKKYPNNINLPDGAVQLSYAEATKTFSYATSSTLGELTLDASKICFPASIYYFQSSDLAATAMELDASKWPTSTTKWTGTEAPWLNDASNLADGWTPDVKATTRSIAMRQNINYGVASLKTTVKCNAATLADNTSLTVVDPTEFTGSVKVPAGGFHVTGLLIGGQPTEVKYDFQPASSDEFDYTIYDRNLSIFAKNGIASLENYTIVLPNDLGRSETTQKTVNVAIELENKSGADFRGADGIVPKDGKFYLVGQLKPGTAKNKADFTNPAVFMRDYQTTLSLNIKSLANAYNTIPDLRSTKLQFGLSVNLEWQKGLQFDVEIK